MFMTKTRTRIATTIAVLCLAPIPLMFVVAKYHPLHNWEDEDMTRYGYQYAAGRFILVKDSILGDLEFVRHFWKMMFSVRGDTDTYESARENELRSRRDFLDQWSVWERDYRLVRYVDLPGIGGGGLDVPIDPENPECGYVMKTWSRRLQVLSISQYALVLPLLITAAFFLRYPYIRHRRKRRHRCIQCGYDLTALTSPQCPECGLPAPDHAPEGR